MELIAPEAMGNRSFEASALIKHKEEIVDWVESLNLALDQTESVIQLFSNSSRLANRVRRLTINDLDIDEGNEESCINRLYDAFPNA